MLQMFVITLREGIEAFLIVAIALAYLRKTGRDTLVPAVFWGTGAGITLSLILGINDSEPLRRPTFQRLVARGAITDGIAADDGVALHYVGTRLQKAVSSRPRAKAYRVRKLRNRAVETRIPTKYLGARTSTK